MLTTEQRKAAAAKGQETRKKNLADREKRDAADREARERRELMASMEKRRQLYVLEQIRDSATSTNAEKLRAVELIEEIRARR